MKLVKDLTVKVTYSVGLGNIEMPDIVHQQLLKAFEKGHEIDSVSYRKEYQEASEWLVENIREKDCFDWEAEITELE
jgi:hypothetical protein